MLFFTVIKISICMTVSNPISLHPLPYFEYLEKASKVKIGNIRLLCLLKAADPN